MMKKLYKSESNKQIAGVCGGIGEFIDIDPTLIRVGYVFVTIVTGFVPGLIAYPILAVIIPSKDEVKKDGKKVK